MSLVLIGLAVLTLALVGVLFLRSGRSNPATASTGQAQPAAPVRPTTSAASAPAAIAAPMAMPVEPPPALAAFSWINEADLGVEDKAHIVKVFGRIPRPSRLLNHLLSPEFLGAASSAQLVELITAEPLIAAKVLATVNSPLYGLKNPLAGIGQAVTYLGLNAVRGACLQYILIATVKAESPERQRALDGIWRASALASELAQQLAQRLNLPDGGQLVSAVVLSFLGRLGTVAVMPADLLAQVPARNLLARAQAEQERFGLPACEIGRLLMREWGLPKPLADEAAAIDRVLTQPRSALDKNASHRLALGYLCARLGERLAAGEMGDLLAFDLPAACASGDAEWFHLHPQLADPRLARLADYLRAPMLSGDLQRMLKSWS